MSDPRPAVLLTLVAGHATDPDLALRLRQLIEATEDPALQTCACGPTPHLNPDTPGWGVGLLLLEQQHQDDCPRAETTDTRAAVILVPPSMHDGPAWWWG